MFANINWHFHLRCCRALISSELGSVWRLARAHERAYSESTCAKPSAHAQTQNCLLLI